MSLTKRTVPSISQDEPTIQPHGGNLLIIPTKKTGTHVGKPITTSSIYAKNSTHQISKALVTPIKQAKLKYPILIEDMAKPEITGFTPLITERNYQMELGLSYLAERVQQLEKEKVEVSKRLQEEQSKYHSLVGQIPAITYLVTLENPGKLLFISHQIEKLGFNVEELLREGMGLLGHIHEEDNPHVMTAYQTAAKLHKPFHYEYRLKAKNGRIHWFRDDAKVIREGNDILYQGVLTEITHDKDIKQELNYYRNRMDYLVEQRTQQLGRQNSILKSANANLSNTIIDLHYSIKGLHQILETMGEGVIGIDSQGCCNYTNKSAARILGFAENELKGLNIQTLLISHSNEAAMPYLLSRQEFNCKAFIDEQPQHCAGEFQHKQLGVVSVEFSVYPLQLDGNNTGAVLIFREISVSLCYQATHDSLTGALSRREFERLASRALSTAINDHSEHALCYLDIDHFKTINDTYGHAAGDELLRALMAQIKSKLRSRDAVGRMGGDEFAILFEHTTIAQVFVITKDLCASIGEFRFPWHGIMISVSVSIGIAPLNPEYSMIADVINAADHACLRSKQNGRNQVILG